MMNPSLLSRAIILALFAGGVFVPTTRADQAASDEMREPRRAWVAFRDAETALLQISGGGAGNTEKESRVTDCNHHRFKELQDLVGVTN